MNLGTELSPEHGTNSTFTCGHNTGMLRVPVASFDENPEGAVQKFTHFIYVQSQAKNIAKQQVIRRNGYGYLAEQRSYRSVIQKIRGNLGEYGGSEQAKLQVIERAERRLVRHRY